jgi:hypothetical protein
MANRVQSLERHLAGLSVQAKTLETSSLLRNTEVIMQHLRLLADVNGRTVLRLPTDLKGGRVQCYMSKF